MSCIPTTMPMVTCSGCRLQGREAQKVMELRHQSLNTYRHSCACLLFEQLPVHIIQRSLILSGPDCAPGKFCLFHESDVHWRFFTMPEPALQKVQYQTHPGFQLRLQSTLPVAVPECTGRCRARIESEAQVQKSSENLLETIQRSSSSMPRIEDDAPCSSISS